MAHAPHTGRGGWRGVLALLACFLLLSAGASAQSEEVAAALAKYDAQIAEMEAQLREEPDHPSLWASLIMARSFRLAVERNASGVKVDEQTSREVTLSMIQEWIDAQPWNSAAHVYYGQILPKSEQPAYFQRLTDTRPGDPEVAKAALNLFRYSGETELASAMVDRLVATSPDSSEAWALAHSHYTQIGATGRASELIDGWVAARPGDSAALELWFTRELQVDRSNAAANARLAVESLQAAPGAHRLCGRIGAALRGELAEIAVACYSKLLAAGPSEKDQPHVAAGLSKMEVAAGIETDLTAGTDGLPTQDRDRLLAERAAREAAAGRCDQAIQLLETGGFGGSGGTHHLGGVFGDCASDPSYEERLVTVSRRIDADGLRGILNSHSLNPVPEGLASLARNHLRADPTDANLWLALDRAYERSGDRESRIELLRSWIAATENGSSTRYVKLSELLTELGRIDEAIALFEGRARQDPSIFTMEHLANLYLRSGRSDEARALANRIQALEPADAARAELLLARLAWMDGDIEGAADAYRRHLQIDGDHQHEALREYSYLVVGLERENELFALLEERYEWMHVRNAASGGLESWVATQLEEIGMAEAANAYLTAAAAKAPSDLRLQQRIAQTAAGTGDLDQAAAALRAVVEANRSDPHAWQRLATLYYEEELFEDASRVLQEARGSVSTSAPFLDLLTAKVYLALGDARAAIGLLRALRSEHPNLSAASTELYRAYSLLEQGEGAPEGLP